MHVKNFIILSKSAIYVCAIFVDYVVIAQGLDKVLSFDLYVFFCIDVLEKKHKVFFFVEVLAGVAAILVEIHSTYEVLVIVGTEDDIFFLDIELFAVESYANDVAIPHPTEEPIYFLLLFGLNYDALSFYGAAKRMLAKDARHLNVVANYNFVEVK